MPSYTKKKDAVHPLAKQPIDLSPPLNHNWREHQKIPAQYRRRKISELRDQANAALFGPALWGSKGIWFMPT